MQVRGASCLDRFHAQGDELICLVLFKVGVDRLGAAVGQGFNLALCLVAVLKAEQAQCLVERFLAKKLEI